MRGFCVLLVDDHPLFREGLMLALARECPGLRISALATPHEAADRLRSDDIDLVLVDHHLPGGRTGLAWGEQWRREHPSLAVALISGDEREGLCAAARGAGFVGFVAKSIDATELLRALTAIARGQTWFQAAAPATTADGGAASCGLTPRQSEIVRLAARGATSRDIAAALGISIATVRNHFAQIFERLGARSRAQAVMLAQLDEARGG